MKHPESFSVNTPRPDGGAVVAQTNVHAGQRAVLQYLFQSNLCERLKQVVLTLQRRVGNIMRVVSCIHDFTSYDVDHPTTKSQDL